MGRSGKPQAQKAHSSQKNKSPLQDAELLQQRAERRKGGEALTLYEQAAVRVFRECLQHISALRKDSTVTDPEIVQAEFRKALERSMSQVDSANAYFGLGETLQGAAEALQAACLASPEADLPAAEMSAAAQAGTWLTEAVAQYQQVRSTAGTAQVRVDALVNSGNALSALAEITTPGERLSVYERSVAAYREALRREEDALVRLNLQAQYAHFFLQAEECAANFQRTLCNLADALVSAAENMQEEGKHVQSRQAYGEAMQAYSSACSMSSSEEGDDLPGLLHNWGVGLHSAGVHLQDWRLLEEAVAKLKDAAGFRRGDIANFNALGDVLFALAEAASPELQPGILQRALLEGFSAALHIDHSHPDALVGSAEVKLQLGRCEDLLNSVNLFLYI